MTLAIVQLFPALLSRAECKSAAYTAWETEFAGYSRLY